MSALDLTTDMLKSSQIRSLVTQSGDGERLIDGILTTESNDEEGILGGLIKIIEKVNSWGAAVSGFMLRAIGGGIGFTFTALMAQIQSISMFIWNFNWNATDEEMDASFAQYQSIIAGQLGGTLGNALGWLVCGGGSGLVVMKFNKLLGARMLKEVGEEALDELLANLRVLVNQAAQMSLRWLAIQTFKSGRKAIKQMLRDPNGPLAKLYKTMGGDLEKVQKWGEKGQKPWSFAIQQELFIESIKNDFWENFTEELIEEFWDACSEAFYVIAGTADQYMLEQKLNKATLLGQQEVVEITPNREFEDEKIILAGPQELIKPVIVQTMTQHQLLEGRSIGNFMGETIEEVANREIKTLMARLVFSSSEARKTQPTTITLYNVDRAKLDWTELKMAMGGSNGYMWGPWQVNAIMDDETTIRVWANTEAEGLDRVNALARFVTGEILTVNSYHQMREGKRITYETLRKDPRRQYPWELLIINPVQILNEENGITTKKGIYKDRQALIPLWTTTRPDDWSEKILELFATPGPNEV